MFTIKNVTTSGNEELFSGTDPMYIAGALGGSAPYFTYTDANDQMHQIIGGKIYVMNEIGRTVARYDLPTNDAFNAPIGLQSGKFDGNYQSQSPLYGGRVA
jgi:hypothetical protein